MWCAAKETIQMPYQRRRDTSSLIKVKISGPNGVICIRTSPSLSFLHLPGVGSNSVNDVTDKRSPFCHYEKLHHKLNYELKLQAGATWQNRTIQLPRVVTAYKSWKPGSCRGRDPLPPSLRHLGLLAMLPW